MKRSPISITTIKKLSDLLLIIGNAEIKIEVLRQMMCKNKSFEPYASF